MYCVNDDCEKCLVIIRRKIVTFMDTKPAYHFVLTAFGMIFSLSCSMTALLPHRQLGDVTAVLPSSVPLPRCRHELPPGWRHVFPHQVSHIYRTRIMKNATLFQRFFFLFKRQFVLLHVLPHARWTTFVVVACDENRAF